MTLKIAATADLHGQLPEIAPADILCIAGDIFPAAYDRSPESQGEWFEKVFKEWVSDLPVGHVVLIGGNHDRYLELNSVELGQRYGSPDGSLIYLDAYSVTLTIHGRRIRIFGSPYCPLPHKHTAFCLEPAILAGKFPSHELARADIILTHTPPSGAGGPGTPVSEPWLDLGCRELERGLRMAQIIPHTDKGDASSEKRPALLFCGHIHQGSHEVVPFGRLSIVNVSYTDNSKMPAYPVRYFTL